MNQTKAIFARLGIRTFRPTLRKAEEKLKGLCTAEGTSLSENTRAELCRHLARLRVVREQIRAVEQECLRKLAAAPAKENSPHAMVRLIARVLGIGIETADMLVSEVLSRRWRDRKAVARYAGLTGYRAANHCARALSFWNLRKRQANWIMPHRTRALPARASPRSRRRLPPSSTADRRASTRKTMIVALARKLLIALWRLVTTAEASGGIALRPAS